MTAKSNAWPVQTSRNLSPALPWPGITKPGCHLCTWAHHEGVFQVKYIHAACWPHGKRAQ